MGNKTKIVEMSIADIDEVMELEKANFSSPWHKEHFEYELTENPFSKINLLKIKDEIIGYYGIWITFEECQITTICIKEDYRQKGYGNLLMEDIIHQATINYCERITLEVRVSNIVAQKLYRKYGFEIVNIRKDYYDDNHEDAYLMIKGI